MNIVGCAHSRVGSLEKLDLVRTLSFVVKGCQKHRKSTQLAESVRFRIKQPQIVHGNPKIQIGLTEPELLTEIQSGLTQRPGLTIVSEKIAV